MPRKNPIEFLKTDVCVEVYQERIAILGSQHFEIKGVNLDPVCFAEMWDSFIDKLFDDPYVQKEILNHVKVKK